MLSCAELTSSDLLEVPLGRGEHLVGRISFLRRLIPARTSSQLNTLLRDSTLADDDFLRRTGLRSLRCGACLRRLSTSTLWSCNCRLRSCSGGTGRRRGTVSRSGFLLLVSLLAVPRLCGRGCFGRLRRF